jgi:membrane-bound serine protease (ClpP class)
MVLPPARRVLAVAGLALAALAGAAAGSVQPSPQPSPQPAPHIVTAELDGAIHPISAEFLIAAMDRADTGGAAALIIVLRTPGGVLDSTRTIVSRMIAARAPIVVYVAPSGARAASAGFLITIAADVAAMAPGTHIGAAHPVGVGGQEAENKTLAEKAASDVAAYARSLAQARQRNVGLSEEAVLKSRSFTEREALEASPPIVDLVALSLDDLIQKLDGREVVRFNGSRATLRTAGARREPVEMTRRQRFLSAIAHPQIAFILFSLGMLGLTIELWNPGSVAPGVVGGVCLLLAFLAFQVLPVDVTGLLLIALGVGLLVLELKIPSFGALGVGGAISLILGAIVLMGDTPGLRVGLEFVVPTMIGLAAVFLFLGRLAMAAQRQPPASGAAAMLTMEGRALTDIAPDRAGQVEVRGEIWSAESSAQVAAGATVRVVAMKGLTLTVAPPVARSQEGRPV